MDTYAKVIVKGSPISKSNFKLVNSSGRSVLPMNSGLYHDRYAIYEETIAYEARSQNPNILLQDGLIAVLKVYYKSEKRHPDTNNIPKSIFDGIEKSGLIINDSQIKTLLIEEFYDKENPRFELELFSESIYKASYTVQKRDEVLEPKIYSPPSNRKQNTSIKPKGIITSIDSSNCYMCNSKVIGNDFISINKGSNKICKKCFSKSF